LIWHWPIAWITGKLPESSPSKSRIYWTTSQTSDICMMISTKLLNRRNRSVFCHWSVIRSNS